MICLAWGMVLAVAAFVVDGNQWLAGLWLIVGASIGCIIAWVGRGGVVWLAPLHDWYYARILRADRRDVLHESIRLRRAGWMQGAESERWLDDQVFVGVLMVVPVVGVLHGALILPIAWAVWPPNAGATTPASVGALLGLVVGPVLFSVLYGPVVACLYRPIMPLPFRTRVVRRVLLVISPFVLLGALWHILAGESTRRPES
jgi:hypothetical protein